MENRHGSDKKQKATILLVEDSSTASLLYQDILKKEGFKVKATGSAIAAFKFLKRKKPDLILLDLVMPVMDGFEFLDQIKQTADIQSIPVIVISADNGKESIIKAKKLGASGYIVKPFSVKILINQVYSKIFKNKELNLNLN